MKFPIRRIPNTVPPRFECFVTVNLPDGGTRVIKNTCIVPPSMEAALCDTLRIAEQLVAENLSLKKAK